MSNDVDLSQGVDQAKDLLRSIASNRCSDFSGTGVVFYSDLAKLPHLQMGTGRENLKVAKCGGCDIASALISVSSKRSPYHDGFHFIDMWSWRVTHVSQFIAPPIPDDAAQRIHGSGARLMSAMLASLLSGITYVGLVSQGGQVHLFCGGIDIADEV
ncbi:hypothetical protein KO507_13320 [Gilvimarinus agarilyticus]|uniref:hypothetical protein n=1 Tax=Gilvimarinus sp. 2_MG-2023 TaxID=3062666 RepID=UPI001C080D00|nr:hypothetical protein [Gilvimarinus sp. 2_MG-2023]MBU2886748.1 hypothetical protein [Gilvimarinus agarilyticus]MDO6571414.1 hypothetical protein [Gilvimarinus sp. 2_MG-2023]